MMGWVWGVGGMVVAGSTGPLLLGGLLVGWERRPRRWMPASLVGWLGAVGWVVALGLAWSHGETRELMSRHLWFGAASVSLEVALFSALAPLVGKTGLLMEAFPRTGIMVNQLLRPGTARQTRLREQVAEQHKGLSHKTVQSWLLENPDPAIWEVVLPHTNPRAFPELLDELANRSLEAAARATIQAPSQLVSTLNSQQRARLMETDRPRLRQQLVRRMGQAEPATPQNP